MSRSALPWLLPGDPFPDPSTTWEAHDPAPGLLAAGGQLDTGTLVRAYSSGIFPWFSKGQPPLWWSPDPRMLLQVDKFRLHRSLRQRLRHFQRAAGCEVRFDTAFAEVICHCAKSPRPGQSGTWIVPEMVQAYTRLHHAGVAHSVETWVHGELVGGLYLVNLGGGVFGESMFSHQTDASKIALAALVAFCRSHGLPWIDCQQNTRHLASMGAQEIPRSVFLSQVRAQLSAFSPAWEFKPLYWNTLINSPSQTA